MLKYLRQKCDLRFYCREIRTMTVPSPVLDELTALPMMAFLLRSFSASIDFNSSKSLASFTSRRVHFMACPGVEEVVKRSPGSMGPFSSVISSPESFRRRWMRLTSSGLFINLQFHSHDHVRCSGNHAKYGGFIRIL